MTRFRRSSDRSSISGQVHWPDGEVTPIAGVLDEMTEWIISETLGGNVEEIEGLKANKVHVQSGFPRHRIGEVGELRLSDGRGWRVFSPNGSQLVTAA